MATENQINANALTEVSRNTLRHRLLARTRLCIQRLCIQPLCIQMLPDESRAALNQLAKPGQKCEITKQTQLSTEESTT